MPEGMTSRVIVPSNVVEDSILHCCAKQCHKGWHFELLCRAMLLKIASWVAVPSNAIEDMVPCFQGLIHLNWIRFNQFMRLFSIVLSIFPWREFTSPFRKHKVRFMILLNNAKFSCIFYNYQFKFFLKWLNAVAFSFGNLAFGNL